MRKERHQKLFNDKFMINTKNARARDLYNLTFQQCRDFEKYIKKIETETDLAAFAKSVNKYLGIMYVLRDDCNKLLDLNLEWGCEKFLKLNKSDQEYTKVIIMANDGEYALGVLLYNDSFSPVIFDDFITNDIFLEGNIAKSICKEIF